MPTAPHPIIAAKQAALSDDNDAVPVSPTTAAAQENTASSQAGNSTPTGSARQKALKLGRTLGFAATETEDITGHDSLIRAQRRQQRLTLQYQQNVEHIYQLALGYTPSNVTGNDLDPDWQHRFFQMAEQIFSRSMQKLWGKILAAELVQPGRFNLHTLEALTRLTQREAKILELAVTLACRLSQDQRLAIVTGYRLNGGLGQVFRRQQGINVDLASIGLPYSSLLNLMDSHILYREEFETGQLVSGQPLALQFGDSQVLLTPKHSHLLLRYYRFTPLGEELAQLLPSRATVKFTKLLQHSFARDFT
ncbi:TIGR03899 family protein [Shewanella sp. NFH-SH190041]|uniref:TIGR03899 family protein n=1 Tax=Shewanella sp. NFH-SH190041 TaxID=2950245 RepID=UPI0021C32438|nr:TIGR03899 family protein [Shewanella sp. NFH-SH190041]BDM65512.1 TIGR03899 family protein [Shewanella sp. NFH-SH190041]